MTKQETELLQEVRGDLRGYRDELQDYAQKMTAVAERCVGCRRQIDEHHTVLYGIPGQKNAPGMIAQVRDLLNSRRLMVIGIRALWGVALLILGALVRTYL